MSTTKILILSVLLVFALSVPAFAADPWIALTNPNPNKIWQASSGTMVPAEPMTVWQTEPVDSRLLFFAQTIGSSKYVAPERIL